MQQNDLIDLITQLQQGQVLVVEAEAGAGKTWAVMQAIAKLPADKRVAVAAPTHVAKEELMGKLADGTQAQVQFMTTASLAGRYLQMNRNTGELENRFAPKSISYDLIACDEISAVPACDVTRMLQSNSPVVMLGDRCQLDAVMSRQADVWTDEWQRYEHRSFTFVTLKGQHRANGELYEYLHKLRTENLPLVKSIPGGRVLYSVEQFEQDWIDHMRTAYQSGHELSQYCMLAYRNETVARLQLRLRAEVFASANFVTNEVVRVDSADGLSTGQLLTVLSSSESQSYLCSETIPISTCQVQTKTGDIRWLKAIHPSFLAQWAMLMQSLKDNKEWDKFFKLSAEFAVIENANAMTGHKSQGRTIAYNWAHSVDIGTRQKLRYVSCSRAAKCLTVVWPYELWKSASKKLLGNLTAAELDAMRGQVLCN